MKRVASLLFSLAVVVAVTAASYAGFPWPK
jgi:hypothetical protein